MSKKSEQIRLEKESEKNLLDFVDRVIDLVRKNGGNSPGKKSTSSGMQLKFDLV